MAYLLHLLVLAAIFGILAISLDLLAGHAGQISLAQVAFFATGAYCSALLSSMGWPFIASAASGIAVSAAFGGLLLLATARLRGDAMALATLAAHALVWHAINNLDSATNGPLGIGDIPRPDILGVPFESSPAFALLAVAAWGVTRFLTWALVRSPYGRLLHALREDESLFSMTGNAPTAWKAGIGVMAGATAAPAGVLYSHYTSYIDPTSFPILDSVLILAIVVVGGPASRWGPTAGVGIMILLPELLRLAGLAGSMAANLRQILFGVLLLLIIFFRPRGLFGAFDFRFLSGRYDRV